MPPPPGARLVRDNGNGTSQWTGPSGGVIDVDHTRPDMADFAEEVRRTAQAPAPAGVQPQARYADNGGAAQPAVMSQPVTAADFAYNQNQSMQPSAASSTGDAPPPMSINPNYDPRTMSVDYSSYVSDPDVHAAQQRAAQEQARETAVNVSFANPGVGPSAASPNRASSFLVPGRAGHPQEVVRGRSVTQEIGDAPIPGLLEDVQRNANMQESAQMHLGKIEQGSQADWERTLQNRNAQIGDMMGRSVDNERGRADTLANARRSFEDIANQARSMSVDPDRRTGGNRVASAIAALLGGIGSGITGGPNHAIQVIEHAIDRDVEAQRANITARQHGVESARTAYQLARDQGASERDAERIHMGYEYQRAADEAERLAALTGSQSAMDRAQLLVGPMRERAAALLSNVNHLQSGRTSETTQYGVANVGGSATRLMIPYRDPTTGEMEMRDSRVMDQHLDRLNVPPADRRRVAQELGYMVGDNAGAGELSNQSASRIQRYTEHAAPFRGAVSALTRLQRLLQDNPGDLPGTGTFAGRLNRYLIGEQGRHLRQELGMANLLAIYAASGKQIGQQEQERLQNATRLIDSANPDEIRTGVQLLDSLVGAPYRQLMAGLSTDERTELQRREAEVDASSGGAQSSNNHGFTPVGGR